MADRPSHPLAIALTLAGAVTLGGVLFLLNARDRPVSRRKTPLRRVSQRPGVTVYE